MANEKRLIYADALAKHMKDLPTWWADDGGVYPGGSMKYPDGMYYPEDIISSIDNAPTVEAVEVVRCKDCRWYEPVTDCGFDEATGRRDYSKIVKKDYGECHGQDFVFTEDGCLRVGDNDFCSYGERKGGDGDD